MKNPGKTRFTLFSFSRLTDIICDFVANMQDDLKDWTIDVLTDALTRAEETAKQK